MTCERYVVIFLKTIKGAMFDIKSTFSIYIVKSYGYSTYTMIFILVYDLVPKGVHENRTKGVENKVDDTLKLVVFLECAQC